MKNLLLQITKGLAFFLLLSFVGNGYAQETKELLTTSELKFSYTEGSCSNQGANIPFDFAFLKIENLTNQSITLGFNYEVQYQEGCSGCNGSDESRVSMTLLPNQVLEADCNSTDKTLIFIRNPNFAGSWNFQEIRITHIDIQ